MIVTVEALPWLSELISGTTARREVLDEDVPDHATLRDLLQLLVERYPKFGTMVYDSRGRRLTGHSEVAVNGTLCDQLGGLDMELSAGDRVTFLPGIAGGEGLELGTQHTK